MKKSIAIPILVFGGVVALSAISNAYALYTLPSVEASFGITQEIEYYLKGTFNSWTESNTYRFVNNTNEMGAEEGKIREYKLENIALGKDAELKVWANNDVWFKDGENNCSYDHIWSNSVSYSDNDDHNYIVPMTSNTYSFYLKFYSNGSSKLSVVANKDVLYFIPSNHWKESDATFYIEQFNSEDDGTGEARNLLAKTSEDPTGVFRFDVGTTYPKYKFARRDSTGENPWNISYIQTIGNSDTNNCFELWDEYWGGGEVWSNWNPEPGSTPGVSCGVWSAR